MFAFRKVKKKLKMIPASSGVKTRQFQPLLSRLDVLFHLETSQQKRWVAIALYVPGGAKSDTRNGPKGEADVAAENSKKNNDDAPFLTAPPATSSNYANPSRSNNETSSTATITTVSAIINSLVHENTFSSETIENILTTAAFVAAKVPPANAATRASLVGTYSPSPQSNSMSPVAFYPTKNSSAISGGGEAGGKAFNDVLKALLTSTVVTTDGSRVLAPTFAGISTQHELKYCGPMGASQALTLSRVISRR